MSANGERNREHDRPEPMRLCGTWTAIPTADQGAVLDALDLSDPMPVTMRLGAGAWNRDHHDWYEHNDCRRTYVSPAEALCAEAVRLSARFGEAHWYGASCGDGWTAWCIARHGKIVRFFDNFDESDEAEGPADAEESEESEESEKSEKSEDDAYSTDVAAKLSVNPEELGPHTRVQGRGVLALTSCGRERGAPTGVLDV